MGKLSGKNQGICFTKLSGHPDPYLTHRTYGRSYTLDGIYVADHQIISEKHRPDRPCKSIKGVIKQECSVYIFQICQRVALHNSPVPR